MCIHKTVLLLGLTLVTLTNPLLGEQPVTTAAPATVKPTVSKETTYLTGPLKADGTVDYVVAINHIRGGDLPITQSTTVELVRTLGPEILHKNVRKRVMKLLGVSDVEGQAAHFISIREYAKSIASGEGLKLIRDADDPREVKKAFEEMKESMGPEAAELMEAFAPKKGRGQSLVTVAEQLAEENWAKALSGPWKSNEYPVVAGWLKKNAGPLDQLAKIARQQKWYLPVLPGIKADETVNSRVVCPSLRMLCKALATRCMLSIGEGKFDVAWTDAETIILIAEKIGRNPTLIDGLVSLSLSSMGDGCVRKLAQASGVTAEQAMKLLGDYRDGKVATLAECLRLERLPELAKIQDLPPQGVLQGIDAAMIVWNELFDAYEKAESHKVFADRLTAWRNLRQEFFGPEKNEDEQMKEFVFRVKRWKEAADKAKNKAELRKLLNEEDILYVLKMVAGNYEHASKMFMRAKVDSDLTRIVMALTAYRLDNGKYPESLDRLLPKYLKSVPPDRFTDKPLKYVPRKDGYLVYSLGADMKDHGPNSFDNPKAEFPPPTETDVAE